MRCIMAEHLPDDESVVPPFGGRSERDRLKAELRTFAVEVELLRGAAKIPELSRRLRRRVLDAATSAYQVTRRWTQVRHAAAFLALCLGTSWALSPLTTVQWPKLSAMMAQLAQIRPPFPE